MHPLLFELGPVSVYGYGAMIDLGILISGGLAWLRRDKLGLPDQRSFWLLAVGFAISCFAGGKILNGIQHGWNGFTLNSGYSALGGFVAAPLWVALFARWKRIPFLKLLDYSAFYGLIGHAIGRVGCFLGGCCYGRPTDLPWGVVFTNPYAIPSELRGVPLHPTQLYEFAGKLLIAALLWRVLRATEEGKCRPGLVAAGHFASYGVLRFLLEYLRGDSLSFLGALSQGQALSLGLVAAAAGIMLSRKRNPIRA